jgi:glycosyltransferase involved in cell wall biosynthesis
MTTTLAAAAALDAPPSAESGAELPPLLHVLAPAPFGGLERVVHALAAGQARRGMDVHVAALVDRGGEGHPFTAGLRAEGVPVHEIALPPRAYRAERAAVRALCRATGARVVHTHGYRPDVLDASAARALGLATVTTVHGFTGGGWKNRLYERLQRRAYRRFDAVVAVSRALAEALAAAGVPRAILHALPNAWSPAGAPPLDREAAREALGVPPGAFHLGWVGRVSREKGLDVLLEALPALAAVPAHLSVLGDGPERGRLEARAAALGVADRVRWYGAVPGAARWLRGLDAFVLSSRTEGTPVALLEAMDAGVPVAAAAVGGVPDVVTPAEALLVPPESPAALAAALLAIHAAPAAAAARAARAGERLRVRHGVEPWLDAYALIYRHVLSPSSRPA